MKLVSHWGRKDVPSSPFESASGRVKVPAYAMRKLLCVMKMKMRLDSLSTRKHSLPLSTAHSLLLSSSFSVLTPHSSPSPILHPHPHSSVSLHFGSPVSQCAVVEVLQVHHVATRQNVRVCVCVSVVVTGIVRVTECKGTSKREESEVLAKEAKVEE